MKTISSSSRHTAENRPPGSPRFKVGRLFPIAILTGMLALSPSAPSAQESAGIIPELHVGDQVFTNASVIRAMPAGLVIRHATGGATVPYDELPPELSNRYRRPAPVPRVNSAGAVASPTPAQQQRYQRDALHAHWLSQQRRVEQRLEPLRDELSRIDRIMPVMANRARGTGRRSGEHLDLIRLRERKIGLLNEISTIEAELRRIRDHSLDALR